MFEIVARLPGSHKFFFTLRVMGAIAQLLKDPNSDARTKAAMTMHILSDSPRFDETIYLASGVHSSLVDLLSDKNFYPRYYAAQCLARRKKTDAIGPLTILLEEVKHKQELAETVLDGLRCFCVQNFSRPVGADNLDKASCSLLYDYLPVIRSTRQIDDNNSFSTLRLMFEGLEAYVVLSSSPMA